MDALSLFVVIHNSVMGGVLLFVLAFWIVIEKREEPAYHSLASLVFLGAGLLFAFAVWQGTRTTLSGFDWYHAVTVVSSIVPAIILVHTLCLHWGRLPPLWTLLATLTPSAAVIAVTYGSPEFDLSYIYPKAAGVSGSYPFIHGTVFALAAAAAQTYLVATSVREVRRRYMFTLFGSALVLITLASIFLAPKGVLSYAALFGTASAISLVAGLFIMAYALDSEKFLVNLKSLSFHFFLLAAVLAVMIDVFLSRPVGDAFFKTLAATIIIAYVTISLRRMAGELKHARDLEYLNHHLVEINGKLIDSDKLKTRLVSFATHQLNAPIAGIRGYLTMMAQVTFGPLTQQQRDVLSSNLDVIGRLRETVDTFLGIAKLEGGKPKLFALEADIDTLVRRVAESLKPLAAKKGIALQWQIDPRAKRVVCDQGQLYHALSNLVHNAIKATEKGSVWITVKRDDGRAAFSVLDTGMGLSPDERKELLRTVRKGLAGLKFESSGGSGLGLIVVKDIVDAHEGTVFIESKGKGKGSAFGFVIPMDGPRGGKGR